MVKSITSRLNKLLKRITIAIHEFKLCAVHKYHTCVLTFCNITGYIHRNQKPIPCCKLEKNF